MHGDFARLRERAKFDMGKVIRVRMRLHGRKRGKLQPWNFGAVVLHAGFNKRRIATYSRTYSYNLI